MEDFCLYQHLGCTEREAYRGERWGNWESVSACLRGRGGAAYMELNII